MEFGTRLPLWAPFLIVAPQTSLVLYSLICRDESADQAKRGAKGFTVPVGLLCGVLTLLAAIRAANYSFLVYFCGWHAVRSKHWYWLAKPKDRPWIVSNGDRVTEGSSCTT
jgi:hypothetical protein